MQKLGEGLRTIRRAVNAGIEAYERTIQQPEPISLGALDGLFKKYPHLDGLNVTIQYKSGGGSIIPIDGNNWLIHRPTIAAHLEMGDNATMTAIATFPVTYGAARFAELASQRVNNYRLVP